MAKELSAAPWPAVGGRPLAGLAVDHLRTEGLVRIVQVAAAGVQRSGDELPERLELLKRRLVGIEIMRRREMHVGGDPERVADALALEERQDVGELELAAA